MAIRNAGLLFLILSLLSLSACTGPSSPSPVAAPSAPATTPTRTRQPTITRLPTLTPMPTHPPTVTPIGPTPYPAFPPEAQAPADWPPLPADLYFLRDGRLWRWAAAGGPPEEMAGSAEEPVVDYRIATEGRTAAYLTGTGSLYVLDLPTGEHWLIPTADRLITTYDEYGSFLGATEWSYSSGQEQFDLTIDGRYLVYMGWYLSESTSPTPTDGPPDSCATGTSYGTIFAIDLENPEEQSVLGYCRARSLKYSCHSCTGFRLAPDGEQIVFSDGQGIWVSRLPEGGPRLVWEHENIQDPDAQCGFSEAVDWSADSHWLVAYVNCWGGELRITTLLDTVTGQIMELPGTPRFMDGGILVSYYYPEPWSGSITEEGYRFRYLYKAEVTAADGLSLTIPVSRTIPGLTGPIAPHLLPDNRVAAAYQGCPDGSSPGPGVLALEEDGSFTLVAPLPALPCCFSSQGACRSSLFWAPNGAAFLYLVDFKPAVMGLTDGSALWDVRELLAGASQFRWAGVKDGNGGK